MVNVLAVVNLPRTYDDAFVDRGLPGLSLLYPPRLISSRTLPWQRSAWFDLFPPLQFLVPPASEGNFQRRLVLAWLQRQGHTPVPGFDSDWAILMTAGHGGIGHLDVFEDDAHARDWYGARADSALRALDPAFGFSLKEFLAWFDHDARGILGALGPTPTVGGAIPKLLLSIPATGWDGRVELEALALALHREAGFAVPRSWVTAIHDIPAIAIERFDRSPDGRPLCSETLYSLMAIGDRSVDNHYSSSYDAIARAYSIHNELCAMPFGDYGQFDERERLVHYDEALERFRKRLGFTPRQYRELAEEMLAASAGYAERVAGLHSLPGHNQDKLIRIVQAERARLEAFFA